MENNNPSANSGHGNNFFSGFLLGALVGAAMVLLFVTKRGKKILKAISEESEGKLSNILNKLENSVNLEDEESEDEPSFASTPVEASAGKGNETKRKVVIQDKPKLTRRFFRGISRHN